VRLINIIRGDVENMRISTMVEFDKLVKVINATSGASLVAEKELRSYFNTIDLINSVSPESNGVSQEGMIFNFSDINIINDFGDFVEVCSVTGDGSMDTLELVGFEAPSKDDVTMSIDDFNIFNIKLARRIKDASLVKVSEVRKGRVAISSVITRIVIGKSWLPWNYAGGLPLLPKTEWYDKNAIGMPVAQMMTRYLTIGIFK
jgi:hypothetical protein